MRPDHQEFSDGLKLATVAVLSAVLTATVVIGAGRAFLPRPEAAATTAQPQVILTSAR